MEIMVNPLRAAPQDFDVVHEGAQNQDVLRLHGSRTYAKFFIPGILVHVKWNATTGLGTAIQIVPEKHTFSRFLAVVGFLLKTRAMYFSCYQKGVSFTTRQKRNKGSVKSPELPNLAEPRTLRR